MDLTLYEDAILLIDLPTDGLLAGDIGTVVDRHQSHDGVVGYSVEFFDLLGDTTTVVTVPASLLSRLSLGDRVGE